MFEKRINLSDRIPLKGPLVVHCELSNKCNFSCRMCPESLPDYDSRVGGYKTMSLEKFQDICAQLIEFGGADVMRLWIMGEPLLVKGIGEYISYAKKSGATKRVEITTNGSALTDDKINEILIAGVDLIKVSIYSPYQERNEHITQKKFLVEKIYNNLSKLHSAKSDLNSNVKIVIKLIEPFDDKETQLFLEKYRPLCDEILIDYPHDWVGGNESGGMLENRYGSGGYQLSAEVSSQKKICPMPFYTIAIHSDGTVGGCCVDWEKKINFGNCFESSLKDIWNDRKHKDFLKTHLNLRASELPACSNCTYFIGATKDNIDDLAMKNIDL